MKSPAVPVPRIMRHLPRDSRGLPIPVIVMWTEDGRPLFAANDEGERQRVIREDRCQICGLRLSRGRWFVGGQLSVCAEHGLNLDSGMHDECAHYALRVCPYLAAPNYGRLVGRQQLARSDRKDVLVVEDGTERNSRPELFVAVMAVAQEVRRGGILPGLPDEVVYGVRPKPGAVRKAELWRHGHRYSPTPMVVAEIGAMILAAGDVWRADVKALLS